MNSPRGHSKVIFSPPRKGNDKFAGQNRIIKFRTLPVTVEQISNPHRQFGFQREHSVRVGILADRLAEASERVAFERK